MPPRPGEQLEGLGAGLKTARDGVACRPHMERGQRLQQRSTTPEDTEVRSVELVRRADQIVRAERDHVDRQVWYCRHRVDEQPRADLVCEDRGLWDRVDGPGAVGHEAHRDQLRARADEPLHLVHVEAGVLGPQADLADHQAVLLGHGQPWGDVGVVVGPGDDDLVPRLQGGADGPAERERDGRHVGPEADLVGVSGTEQVSGRQTHVVHQLVGLDAGSIGHAVVGVAREQVVVDGPQAGVDDLGAGCVVKPHGRSLVRAGTTQGGEAIAHGVDVPVGHAGESTGPVSGSARASTAIRSLGYSPRDPSRSMSPTLRIRSRTEPLAWTMTR